jgi:hypothetical protein
MPEQVRHDENLLAGQQRPKIIDYSLSGQPQTSIIMMRLEAETPRCEKNLRQQKNPVNEIVNGVFDTATICS